MPLKFRLTAVYRDIPNHYPSCIAKAQLEKCILWIFCENMVFVHSIYCWLTVNNCVCVTGWCLALDWRFKVLWRVLERRRAQQLSEQREMCCDEPTRYSNIMWYLFMYNLLSAHLPTSKKLTTNVPSDLPFRVLTLGWCELWPETSLRLWNKTTVNLI